MSKSPLIIVDNSYKKKPIGVTLQLFASKQK